MADKKSLEDLSDITVSQTVLAECLGVSDRMIRHLAEDGIIKRNSRGRYLLLSSVKNYILALKVSKAGKNVPVNVSGNVKDLNTEKAIHEHTKNMIAEVKLNLILGKVHKAEVVGRVLTDMFTNFRSKILALPAKLCKKIEGKGRIEIQDILKKELEAALTELADYSPADYYSDEFIDVDETNVLNIGDDDEEM